MISSADLKKSEIAEDIDYLDADEVFPDDNDELKSFDDLDFSDDPKGEENIYVSMKDADDIAAQVQKFSTSFARKNITPLKSATEHLNETADDNAAAREELFEKLEKIEKQKEIAENFIEKFEGVTLEKIKNLNDEQLKIIKEEAEKIIDNCQADSINLAKFQMEAWMDRMIQIKLAEAYKQIDEYQAAADKKIEEKFEKIHLADLELLEREEKLLEEKKELIKEKEKIQQKIDEFDQKVEEFYKQQEIKQQEIEGMVVSLVEQNNTLRDNLENEKKEKLRLKIVIEEQNKTIAAQTEQSEKLIITIKEENDQKAQILKEKEELFDVIQKKDERRREEIREQNEEIKNLRQAMIEKEKKIERSNSILTFLICVVFIFWAVAGFFVVGNLEGLLKTLIKTFSWSSFAIGFGVLIFKFYKGMWK